MTAAASLRGDCRSKRRSAHKPENPPEKPKKKGVVFHPGEWNWKRQEMVASGVLLFQEDTQ